jgi:hypothetical protein
MTPLDNIISFFAKHGFKKLAVSLMLGTFLFLVFFFSETIPLSKGIKADLFFINNTAFVSTIILACLITATFCFLMALEYLSSMAKLHIKAWHEKRDTAKDKKTDKTNTLSSFERVYPFLETRHKDILFSLLDSPSQYTYREIQTLYKKGFIVVTDTIDKQHVCRIPSYLKNSVTIKLNEERNRIFEEFNQSPNANEIMSLFTENADLKIADYHMLRDFFEGIQYRTTLLESIGSFIYQQPHYTYSLDQDMKIKFEETLNVTIFDTISIDFDAEKNH